MQTITAPAYARPGAPLALNPMGALAQNIAIRIATEATIIHPTRGRIRFSPYDYQTKLWLDTSPMRLILKARQIGMSQAVAAEALYKAMLTPNRTILFVSRSLEAAKNLLGQAKAIYEFLANPASKCVRDLQQEMHFANGSRLVSVAAQRSTGRGYPASDVYIDECAFIQWADEIYQAILPTVAQGGTMTILSTPNGQQGLFFDLWIGKYGNEWSKHTVPFWRCPTYTEAWYLSKVKGMTTSQFATEFECSFESSGAPVFRREAIEFCSEGAWGFQPASPGRLYITAWDIARRRDFSVGITIDATTPIHQIVRYERWRDMPFPIQQQQIATRWQQYRGLHIVESNNQGDVVIENLPEPAQSWVVKGMHLTQMVMHGVPVLENYIVPFSTQSVSKKNIITALQLATEAHRWKFNPNEVPEHKDELLHYQWDDENLVQDTVIAGAIAEWAAQHVPIQQILTMEERVDISGWDNS